MATEIATAAPAAPTSGAIVKSERTLFSERIIVPLGVEQRCSERPSVAGDVPSLRA
jgi:hypothetical protein